MNGCSFTQCVSNICRNGVPTALFGCYTAGAACNCCRLCARSVYTIQPCTSSQCHFIQRHKCMVHVCLAVPATCTWGQSTLRQNDRDLLRDPYTAVTRGWNEYQNKSQHRKLTLAKKILPPLLPGFKPATCLTFLPLSYPRYICNTSIYIVFGRKRVKVCRTAAFYLERRFDRAQRTL